MAQGERRGGASGHAPDDLGGVRRCLRAPKPRQLHAVIEAQRILACAPPDPETIFSLLAEAAVDVLEAEGAVVAQTDGDALVARAVAGTTRTFAGDRIPLEGTLGGLAVATGVGQLCTDGRHDPRTQVSINKRTGTLSSVVVPLVHDGAVIALVAALSSQPFAFDEAELSVLEMLADVGANRLSHALDLQAHDADQAQATAVLEAMSDGMIVQEPDGTIVFVNRAAERILGARADLLLGCNARDAGWRTVHADGTPWPVDEHPAMVAAATGEAQRDELLGVHTDDGRLRWLAVSAVPVAGPDGAVVAIVITFVDITERREAVAALAASEQHFRVAFDNAPIGMSMISLARPGPGVLPAGQRRVLRDARLLLRRAGRAHDAS